MIARIPPQSVDSEVAVLGGLMLDPNALAKVRLTAADFYRRDHAMIYRAICELASDGKPYDAVTLGDWFDARGESRLVQGGAYLIDLASTTPSAANIRAYAAIVRDKAMMRRAIDIGSALVNASFEPNGVDSVSVLDTAIRELMALTKDDQSCEFTLKQAMALAWADVEAAASSGLKVRGVPTGYARMDARLGGWHNGDLAFIGARPSMGKTAIMVNLALNAAAAGHSVGIISGEQSAMQLGQRSIAAAGNVHAERMRNGDIDDEAWGKLHAAIVSLAGHRIQIFDRAGPTMDDVSRMARKWKQEYGIGILFVDYLQRISMPKAKNRVDEVAEVARGMKTLARDLEIPVVCLAQVKAEVDKRPGDKRPTLGDIANSDEATREADLIAFLYRDDVYHDDSRDAHIAELNVEKYRHGPTGRFKLRFEAETMRFTDLASDGWH